MAQNKPFTWYAEQDAVGYPGLKADATTDVIDSLAAESGINPGDPVLRGTNADQVKAATAATDGKNVIGVAVHVHREPAESGAAYYEAGYTVPVMTFGDIYVTAGGDVAPGDAVDIAFGDDKVPVYTKSAGTNTVPNMTFLDKGAKGDVVRVRIRH